MDQLQSLAHNFRRAIKSEDEIACMVQAIAVCEAGMARMRGALRPGMTENELWAILHETNIRLGGEWIETRCLCAGDHTNPWLACEHAAKVLSAKSMLTTEFKRGIESKNGTFTHVVTATEAEDRPLTA